ncbi:hypothetical protein FKP32DRAFT_412319 [Trametes sanguinea]|nr:hypothetical protein FKP32DRAFT_412319 [Trametes sanguinea]
MLSQRLPSLAIYLVINLRDFAHAVGPSRGRRARRRCLGSYYVCNMLQKLAAKCFAAVPSRTDHLETPARGRPRCDQQRLRRLPHIHTRSASS